MQRLQRPHSGGTEAIDSDPQGAPQTPMPVRRAHPMRVAWAIAWRHIKESLRNRSTYIMGAFYLLLPLGLVLFTLRPAFQSGAPGAAPRALGTLMAIYLLMAGLLPCTWSVGIAAGAFAAEKEQGSLVPLLATPASNGSIFAGKVLGSVLPAMTLAVVGLLGYLGEIALLFGWRALALLPPAFTGLTLLLLPATSLLAAGVSSMISARVNTEQVANQYGSIILSVIWLGLFFIVARITVWGLGTFAAAVAAIFVAACVLILISAATWRREEVMARR